MRLPATLRLSRPLSAAIFLLSTTASLTVAQTTSPPQIAPRADDLTTPLVTERAFVSYAENQTIALLRWRRDQDTALSYDLSKLESKEAQRILETLRRANLDAAAALAGGATLAPPEDLTEFMAALQSR